MLSRPGVAQLSLILNFTVTILLITTHHERTDRSVQAPLARKGRTKVTVSETTPESDAAIASVEAREAYLQTNYTRISVQRQMASKRGIHVPLLFSNVSNASSSLSNITGKSKSGSKLVARQPQIPNPIFSATVTKNLSNTVCRAECGGKGLQQPLCGKGLQQPIEHNGCCNPLP